MAGIQGQPFAAPDFFSLDPMELIKVLQGYVEEAGVYMPESIDACGGSCTASEIMAKAIALYSFFSEQELIAGLRKKEFKKRRDAKEPGAAEKYEEFISYEHIFSVYADRMKTIYNAISRLFTVKIHDDEELRMYGYTT